MSIFAMCLNNSAARWGDDPTPGVAKATFSSLARAMNSGSAFAGELIGTTMRFG
jgi:hypothetical protein